MALAFEYQLDNSEVPLTTMNKNSEVLRCSSELRNAFKMIPSHYRKQDLNKSMNPEKVEFEEQAL